MTSNEIQENINLSRRGFLTCLATVGVGVAAATVLSIREADAATEIDIAGKARNQPAADETTVEDKKVQLTENIDPDDPLQHYAGVRRGVARRVARRERRSARRAARRARRVAQ